MFHYALKEIGRRWRTYLLNVTAIALVVVALVTLGALGDAYKEAMRIPFESVGGSIVVQRNGRVPENTTGVVTSCSLAPVGSGILPAIEGIEGVDGVSSGLFLWVFDEDSFKRVLGTRWDDGLGRRVANGLAVGSIPASGAEALVERTFAEQNGLDAGDALVVAGTRFTVSGVVRGLENEIVSSDVYVDLASAQELAYDSANLQATEPFDPDDVNIILVDADQTRMKDVEGRLRELLGPEGSNGGRTPTGQTIGTYAISTPASFEERISSLFLLSDRLTAAISLVAVIGSLLILVKGMGHALMERRREICVMKAVGYTNGDIRKEVLTETLLQVAAGYAVGMCASLLVIQALSATTISVSIPWDMSPYPHFLMADPERADVVRSHPLPIMFGVGHALASLIAVLSMAVATTVALAGYINRLTPMEVLRYE